MTAKNSKSASEGSQSNHESRSKPRPKRKATAYQSAAKRARIHIGASPQVSVLTPPKGPYSGSIELMREDLLRPGHWETEKARLLDCTVLGHELTATVETGTYDAELKLTFTEHEIAGHGKLLSRRGPRQPIAIQANFQSNSDPTYIVGEWRVGHDRPWSFELTLSAVADEVMPQSDRSSEVDSTEESLLALPDGHYSGQFSFKVEDAPTADDEEFEVMKVENCQVKDGRLSGAFCDGYRGHVLMSFRGKAERNVACYSWPGARETHVHLSPRLDRRVGKQFFVVGEWKEVGSSTKYLFELVLSHPRVRQWK